MGLDKKPAEGVSAKVLRSESRVHARDTVNGGAGETPSAGFCESLALGVPCPREGHGQRRCGDTFGRFIVLLRENYANREDSAVIATFGKQSHSRRGDCFPKARNDG